MASTLFHNANQIVTNSSDQLYDLSIIENASLLVNDKKITWMGASADAPKSDNIVDCTNRVLLPGFVDSHSHLVFAGDRSAEFAARMAGESYSAGGIHFTVEKTRAASDEVLRSNISKLIAEMHENGITHYEIKTGYGLTLQDEIRALKIAREFTEDVTLMAAHVVPKEFENNRSEYVDLIINEMLPASVGIAKWVDVFCESGAFFIDESKRILMAAKQLGFGLKIHANQLGQAETLQLAAELSVTSADHCTYLENNDIAALIEKDVVATLLPATEFSTNSPYPDAQKLITAGAKVAIATNCNPGSSFTTSMPFCIAVAVREMNFTTEQAIWAATKGGALALANRDLGKLAVGGFADLVVLDAPSYVHLAYRPGVSMIHSTYISGQRVFTKGGK